MNLQKLNSSISNNPFITKQDYILEELYIIKITLLVFTLALFHLLIISSYQTYKIRKALKNKDD